MAPIPSNDCAKGCKSTQGIRSQQQGVPMSDINHTDERAREIAAALDQLLVQAAQSSVPRFFPLRAGVHFAGAITKRPERAATRAGLLAAELARIAVGVSDVAPSVRDKRFRDPEWSTNPMLKRLVQAYLASGEMVEGLVQDVPMDWREAEQIKFAASNLVAALAPSNNPLISPVAWKALIDSGGANVITGPRHMIRDLSRSPRVPTTVDPKAYTIGKDLAATPGTVILRTPQFELIHYSPVTAKVRSVTLLVVPPTINKYYVLDLAPGSQHGGVPREPGPAGVFDVLAKSGYAAQQMGIRYVLNSDPRCARCSQTHRTNRQHSSTCRVFWWHSRQHVGRAPRGNRPAKSARHPQPARHDDRPISRRDRQLYD